MLESIGNTFEYQKLSQEEQAKRGILGRLVGVIADTVNPTRNGRKYGAGLWEKIFADPIMQEKIQNKVCVGELEHPADGRETIDPERIAICLAETPKKNTKGQLIGIFDVLDTPCGKILKTLLDYGANIGVSSRGSGDTFINSEGEEEVDEDTYNCVGWDAVLVPAVESARLKPVAESLSTTLTLAESLNKLVENAEDTYKGVMEETIDCINKKLSINEINADESLDGKGRVFRDSNDDFKIVDDNNHIVKSDSGEDLKFPTNEEADDYIEEEAKNNCIINNEDTSIDVGNAKSDVDYISDLQKAYEAKQEAEANMTELQEKLSVCYTKEASLNEELANARKRVAKLSESVREARELSKQVSTLTEELTEATNEIKFLKETNSSLEERIQKFVNSRTTIKESLDAKDLKIKELNENVSELTKDLDLKKSQYVKKLSASNKLVEDYKKIVDKAVNRYIESVSLRLGCSSSEIIKQLPKNYTFDDIDNVCEKVQSYQLGVSKLPFKSSAIKQLSEAKQVSVKTSRNEPLLRNEYSSYDDEIDDSFLKAMNLNF